MNIKEARDIYYEFDWSQKRCGSCETNYCEHPKAKGFIEGYEAGVRDAAKLMKNKYETEFGISPHDARNSQTLG